MKTHGMPFRDDMAEAIRKGLKTQTRRLIEPQPVFSEHGCWYPGWTRNTAKRHYASEDHFRLGVVEDFCPWQVGDHIFVQEDWRMVSVNASIPGCQFWAIQFKSFESFRTPKISAASLEALIRNDEFTMGGIGDSYGEWRPTNELPSWAARTWMEITEIRAQRIQDISEEDAKAEGAIFHDGRGFGHSGWRFDLQSSVWATARKAYKTLWDSFYFGSWERNDWVFALTFKLVEEKGGGE